MEEIKRVVEEDSVKLERGKTYVGWTIKCYGDDAREKVVAEDKQLISEYPIKIEEK